MWKYVVVAHMSYQLCRAGGLTAAPSSGSWSRKGAKNSRYPIPASSAWWVMSSIPKETVSTDSKSLWSSGMLWMVISVAVPAAANSDPGVDREPPRRRAALEPPGLR